MAKVVIAGQTFVVRIGSGNDDNHCVFLAHNGCIQECYEHTSDQEAEDTYSTLIDALTTVSRIVGNINV